MKTEKHKWILQDDGSKKCEKCGSKIGCKRGAFKTLERDAWGVMNAVSWYPRCNPLKPTKTFEEFSDKVLDFNKSIGIGDKNAIHL